VHRAADGEVGESRTRSEAERKPLGWLNTWQCHCEEHSDEAIARRSKRSRSSSGVRHALAAPAMLPARDETSAERSRERGELTWRAPQARFLSSTRLTHASKTSSTCARGAVAAREALLYDMLGGRANSSARSTPA
jgi:hypothetical protein